MAMELAMRAAQPRRARALTPEEHTMLIAASDRDHIVHTTFGPGAVVLVPDRGNEWAFELLERDDWGAS
jgi:hypothetical protein